jgi:hypothetical protein
MVQGRGGGNAVLGMVWVLEAGRSKSIKDAVCFSFRALHGWGRKRTLGTVGGELQVRLWEGVDLWLRKQYGGH